MRNSILKDKSFAFAIRVVKLYKHLSSEKNEYVISKQLLRSGAAVGALIREAQNAESRQDFIHKLGIAQKECDETLYWLELLFHTEYLSKDEFESLHKDNTELLKMLRSAIITSKQKLITHNL